MKTDIGIEKKVFDQRDRQRLLNSVKAHIVSARERLKRSHLKGAAGKEIVKEYTLFIDSIIKGLYERFSRECSALQTGSNKGDFALIALGGYGREELNPHSDIDLMLLYTSKLTPFIRKLNEDMLYLMWDLGLDMGYSLRSDKECMQLACDDIKTKTSLLDGRYLAGNEGIYQKFMIDYKRKVVGRNEKDFINAKLEEKAFRHEKYGGSVYILEPNIKEGEGGLRDLHTLLWIAKVKRDVKNMRDLLGERLCSKEELDVLEGAQEFLWRVRNDLHFNAKRKFDQLNFEAQERITRLFNLKDYRRSLGVEEFMRRYYIHANNIKHHSSLIISRVLRGKNNRNLIQRVIKEKKIDSDFTIFNGNLHVNSESIFKDNPEKMMTAFEHYQKLRMDLDSTTEELICKNLSLVRHIRGASEVRDTFVRILLYKERIFRTLEKMHSLRFLGQYIPEFEEVTCRVQHDLYHIYTIDAHSLFAVRELESLRNQEKADAFPFLSKLVGEIERFDLLVLAVLFHDIGKGKGKGHSAIGADMVCTIMDRIGFSSDDKQTVSFLVKEHLLLANLAQYRDIHDIKLITDFARTMDSISMLNMLYLLTFADVKAVGPGVWTHWKGTMFHELYMRAHNVLEKGTFELEGTRDRLNALKETLYGTVGDRLDKNAINKHFRRFPARYLLSNRPENLTKHIEMISLLKGEDFIIETKHVVEKGYTEVIVCAHDIPGLFSMVTGVMASHNVNILKAQINTSRDGIALDILSVNSPLGGPITDKSKWDRIKNDFRNVLEGRVKVSALVKRRKTSILDQKVTPKVSTRIGIDNIVSDDFAVIDIYTQDRIGLLYSVTNALANLGLYIFIAKISTNGEEAIDVFYVKDIFGQKITDERKIEHIKHSLATVIGEEAVEDPQLTDS